MSIYRNINIISNCICVNTSYQVIVVKPVILLV
jgi:hypothetical protein